MHNTSTKPSGNSLQDVDTMYTSHEVDTMYMNSSGDTAR